MKLRNGSTQSWINGQDKDFALKIDLVPVFDASIMIQNVVAYATLNQKFDLNAIVHGNPLVDYRPETFPGLVFRLKRPRTAILIFRTGKMVCTGAKSEKETLKAINKVLKEFETSGIIILGKPEIKIVNIVASVNLLGKIELEDVAYALKKLCMSQNSFQVSSIEWMTQKL